MSAQPTIDWEQYQKLPPGQRSRPLTAAEYAALTPAQLEAAGLADSSAGAPANFSGPVLPNPHGIRPQLDTDPGAPTRLPQGVTFQHGNWRGTTPMDFSKPSPAEILPGMVQQASVNMGAQPIDFSKYEQAPPAAIDFSKYEKPASTAESSGFWDTLQREGKALTGTIAGMPAAVYHAFSEPATAEEKQEFGGEAEVSGAKRVGLGIHRLALAPVETATDWYSQAAKGKIPDAYEQALSVAPEAIGSAAGNVIAGKLAEVGVKGAVRAPGAIQEAAANIKPALAKAGSAATAVGQSLDPDVVGLVSPRAAHALRLATKVGKVATKLGETPLDATEENASYAGEEEPAASPTAALPGTPPAARTLVTDPGTGRPEFSDVLQAKQNAGEQQLHALSGDSALRQILTGQDNANLLKIAKSRGINVAQESQLKPGVADNRLINKIIDDHSLEELDNISAQYEENTRMGKHQFGDVGPEAWKTMSLQQYFPDVKIPAATLRRTQNAIANTSAALPQGIVMDPTTGRPQFSYDVAAKPRATPAAAAAAAPAAGEDLTAILQKSLNQARQRAGVPQSAYDEAIRQAAAEGPAWTPEKAQPVVSALNKNPNVEFEARGSVGEGRATSNDLDLYQKKGNLSDAASTLQNLGFKRVAKTPHGETWTNGAQHIDLWDSEHEPVKGYTGATR